MSERKNINVPANAAINQEIVRQYAPQTLQETKTQTLNTSINSNNPAESSSLDSQLASQTQQNLQDGDPFVVKPPELPTQEAGFGVRYDFNDGARVFLPSGKWHLTFEDRESGNIVFSCDSEGGWAVSTKKYYVPFNIKVWKRGESKPFLDHTLDLKGKEVVLKFPVGTLGDIVGWIPYAEKFHKKHQCSSEWTVSKEIHELFAKEYPDIIFTVMNKGDSGNNNNVVSEKKVRFSMPYASYKMGLFFKGDTNNQPIDFRKVGLHRTAGYILGVDPREEAPRVKLNNKRLIKEPYVCIATKASSMPKMWNNGFGWNEVVGYLKNLGYRVLCIDRESTTGMNYTWNQMPREAEDFTGNISLSERVSLIEHADFFVGLSSGLSWLAWCTKKPIVLISGFTLPVCEFYTPYRVFNSHGCNGCWDDVNCNFEHKNYFWCPKHAGTDRQFECTRLITGKQVINQIENLMKDYDLKPPSPRVKVTKTQEFDVMSMMKKDSTFSSELVNLAKQVPVGGYIIETGTYKGEGTTKSICEGIKESQKACTFWTIEVNPSNYEEAVKNLGRDGNFAYVKPLNGLSIPKDLLPTMTEMLAQKDPKEGFVDFANDKRIRSAAYHAETNFPQCQDDLLGKCLKECSYKPNLLILDSAGHIGFIEFEYVIDKLKGQCIIALDDTIHAKHAQSVKFIEKDPRFKIIKSSSEKFGYCIAEFNPVIYS